MISLKLILPIICTLIISSCTRKQTADTTIAVGAKDKEIMVNDTVFTARYAYANLSEQFDIKVDFARYPKESGMDSSVVKAYLLDKQGNSLDSMVSTTPFYYAQIVFVSDTNVRSYATHVNEDREVVDDYYGDIIVADLNFDGRDDIAIVKETNNAGVLYNYYLQTINKHFIPNAYLNDSIGSFPQEMDTIKRTLTTYNRAGCCHIGKHTYQLRNSDWTEIKHEMLSID